MKIPAELDEVLLSDPEVSGGTICFRGTRVPVATFIDYMTAGYSLERFLHGFPGVNRDQALRVLSWLAPQMKRQIGVDEAA